MNAVVSGVALVLGFALSSAAFAEAHRVASLVPAASDAVVAVAGAGALVASARHSLHVPVRIGVADLGNPHTPDIEALVAARPTLIVADRARQARALSPELAQRAHWLELATVDSTLRSFDALGARLGAAAAMQARTGSARARIAALRTQREVRVLALFGTPGQFQVITNRHWLGDLIEQLGAQRVGPAGPDLPSIVPLSDEVATTLSADLVLIVAHGDARAMQSALAERLAEGGAWQGIASARGGVHALDAERFGANPGLGLGDAAAELALLLEAVTR